MGVDVDEQGTPRSRAAQKIGASCSGSLLDAGIRCKLALATDLDRADFTTQAADSMFRVPDSEAVAGRAAPA